MTEDDLTWPEDEPEAAPLSHDLVQLQYETREGFFATTAATTITVVGKGEAFGQAARSSGLGSIAFSLVEAGAGGPTAVLAKRPLTTGAWDVQGPEGRTHALVTHKLLSRDWDVTDPHGTMLGSVRAGGMRPVGQLSWGPENRHVASFERQSQLTTGLFSRSRIWFLTMRTDVDPLTRIVALLLPIAMDHRERASEKSN